MQQRSFRFRTWGGKRRGAGRRPAGDRAGVMHRKRSPLKARFPVHVTWRMKKEVWNLRSARCFRALRLAFFSGADRFGFKLVHYSVQGTHLHLLVEAKDGKALSSGMNGIGVRVARRLNRVMGRHGKVLADRYHARILRTPSEVRRARDYLLQNAKKHYGLVAPDPYTSTIAVIEPDTFLMRRLC